MNRYNIIGETLMPSWYEPEASSDHFTHSLSYYLLCFQLIGVHPRVCCPRVLKPEPICFPTDVGCATYKKEAFQGYGKLEREILI